MTDIQFFNGPWDGQRADLPEEVSVVRISKFHADHSADWFAYLLRENRSFCIDPKKPVGYYVRDRWHELSDCYPVLMYWQGWDMADGYSLLHRIASGPLPERPVEDACEEAWSDYHEQCAEPIERMRTPFALPTPAGARGTEEG